MWILFQPIKRNLWREAVVLTLSLTFGCPLGVFAARLLLPVYFNGHTSQVSWWKEEAPFIALAGFIVGAFVSTAFVRLRQTNH